MAIKVGINGFGRIGRMVFRAAAARRPAPIPTGPGHRETRACHDPSARSPTPQASLPAQTFPGFRSSISVPYAIDHPSLFTSKKAADFARELTRDDFRLEIGPRRSGSQHITHILVVN